MNSTMNIIGLTPLQAVELICIVYCDAPRGNDHSTHGQAPGTDAGPARRGSYGLAMTSTNEPPTVVETTAKAVLRAIPYVGSSLSTIFEDTHARHVARVAQVVEEVAMAAGVDRLSERLAKDEEIEILFIEGVEIAVRTGLKAKRRLLAKVVAKAVLDDAEIEPVQLLVQAFRDLDAPHLRALVRIQKAEKTAEEVNVDGETNDVRRERIADAAMKTGRTEPTPIIAALIRTGVIYPATLWDGGVAAYGVSEFGRRLLVDLESLEAWS